MIRDCVRSEVNTRLLCTFRLHFNRWFWRRMHPTLTTAWNSFCSNMGIGIRHVRLGACLAHSYFPLFRSLSLSLSLSLAQRPVSLALCLFGFLGFLLSLLCISRNHGNSAFDRVCRNTKKALFRFSKLFFGEFLFWVFCFGVFVFFPSVFLGTFLIHTPYAFGSRSPVWFGLLYWDLVLNSVSLISSSRTQFFFNNRSFFFFFWPAICEILVVLDFEG